MQKQNQVNEIQNPAIVSSEFPLNALADRISRAMESTEPFTKARNAALAQVRWVLRDQFGHYVADSTGIRIEMTADIDKAMVFDGRDNEEFKGKFYNSVTGLDFQAELL